MAIPKSAIVIAVLIALAGSGCTQPYPNAKPTYACTPSDGGTPQPCYKAEHDLQAKEDKLYAEAEAVFRRFLAEEERIYRTGGVSAATPIMLETLTGDYLRSAINGFRALKESGSTAVGGEFKIVWVRPYPAEVHEGTVASVQACIDTHSVQMGTRDDKSKPGRVSVRTAFLARDGESLKIAYGRYRWVTSCSE